MSDTIYRVTVVKFSDGRGVTGREVLYCGADRLVARAAFHRSMVSDYDRDGGYRKTAMESITDSGSEDFAHDVAEAVDA